MPAQVIIGYSTEGTSDKRFLESIIQRTFEEVAFECESQIEVLPLIYIEKPNAGTFVDNYLGVCRTTYFCGASVICIHVDADDENSVHVADTRLNPLIQHLSNNPDIEMCDNIVSVIPVYMTEAWMLADVDLLREEIGTDMSTASLGINSNPEGYSNPKHIIQEAIRLAKAALAKKRRRDLQIADLYQPLGQKISLEKLMMLNSFIEFKEGVRQAFRYLNLLQ